MRVPKVLLPAPKKLDFGPKNGQIWPKTGIFGQISAFLAHYLMLDQKNNVDKLPRWFFYYVGTTTFTYSHKTWDFWPKNGPKYAFLVFWAKYWLFLPIFPMPYQKTMQTRWLGGFSVVWATKLLISSGKIRIFCPKLAFLFILGQALPAHLVPCWWVGWYLWHGLYLASHPFTLYNL